MLQPHEVALAPSLSDHNNNHHFISAHLVSPNLFDFLSTNVQNFLFSPLLRFSGINLDT